MGFLNQLFKHRETGDSSSVGSESAAMAGAVPSADFAGAHMHKDPSPANPPAVPARIRLELGDLLPRVPTQFIRPGIHDLQSVVEFDACDLAAAISRGRVEIPLPKIASQCPDAFQIGAWSASDVLIRLPLQKLVNQMTESTTERSVEASPNPVAEQSVIEPPPPAEPHEPIAATRMPHSAQPDATDDSAPLRVEVRASVDAPLQASLRPMILGATVPPPEVPAAHASASNDAAAVKPIVRLAPIQPPQTRRMAVASSIASAPEPPLPEAQSVASAGPDTVPAQEPVPAPSALTRAAGVKNDSRYESLQPVFMTDETLDLQLVARRIAELPGVSACRISTPEGTANGGTFPDGFSAGNLQTLATELAASAVSAVSAVSAATRTATGDVHNVTLHGDSHTVSVFMRGSVVFGVLLGRRGFVPGVRERLLQVLDSLQAPVL